MPEIHLVFKIPREAFSSQRVFVGKVGSKCAMSFYSDSVELISITACVVVTAVALISKPENTGFVEALWHCSYESVFQHVC